MDWIVFPLLELFGQDLGLISIFSIFWWALAIIIMIYFNGDWKDFMMYFLWSIAITIGFMLLIVPGIILLIYFLWKHGIINLAAFLLGPVGWALGASFGWYE